MADSLLDQLTSPKLRRLYDYWNSKRRGKLLPGRKDIDPVEIPELLSALILVEVLREESGRRFRFRIFGTDHVKYFGHDYTGKCLDEFVEPDEVEMVTKIYNQIVDSKEPQYWSSHLRIPGREFIDYERLMAPLAADGRTVDMLIAVFDFEGGPGDL
jgi:hypothetical protein